MNNSDFGDVDHFYSEYYNLVLQSGLVRVSQDRTHRAIENRWNRHDMFEQVLEVGAGAGNHRKFVNHQYRIYYETDIRFTNVSSNSNSSHMQVLLESNLKREFADITQLHYKDATFNRVIATCLLLHLEKPEAALCELRRVTKGLGVISILVPCEPGLFLRIARSLLTSRKAHRLGFQGYSLFNARDHINHLSGIDQLIRFVFKNDKIQVSRLPFRWPSWNFNFYYVYTIYRGEDEQSSSPK
jgi:phosphatidylethanolamine/phosphatidyl-N-methylethanolamine N-methyltransferase